MPTDRTFFKLFTSLVNQADDLLTQPERLQKESEATIRGIERYGEHLIANWSLIEQYPALAQSFYKLIDREDMTGYLGIFLFDEAIDCCKHLEKTEEELLKKIEVVRASSVNVNSALLNELAEKVKSWHYTITNDNAFHISRFIDSLKGQIEAIYERLSNEEKLGRALKESERERKRLSEQEEARRRDDKDRELDEKERRRLARESFIKSMRRRKK